MNSTKYIVIGCVIVSCILAVSLQQLRVESKQKDKKLVDYTKQVVFG